MRRPIKAPPCPPIVPDYVYPWRRLHDWGFGSRTVAADRQGGDAHHAIRQVKIFQGLVTHCDVGGPEPYKRSIR